MGNLVPGQRLIYERVGDTVYSRVPGESHRTLVGMNLPARRDPLDIKHNMNLWTDILVESEQNPALQAALERVKVLYYLSKKDTIQTLDW